MNALRQSEQPRPARRSVNPWSGVCGRMRPWRMLSAVRTVPSARLIDALEVVAEAADWPRFAGMLGARAHGSYRQSPSTDVAQMAPGTGRHDTPAGVLVWRGRVRDRLSRATSGRRTRCPRGQRIRAIGPGIQIFVGESQRGNQIGLASSWSVSRRGRSLLEEVSASRGYAALHHRVRIARGLGPHRVSQPGESGALQRATEAGAADLVSSTWGGSGTRAEGFAGRRSVATRARGSIRRVPRCGGPPWRGRRAASRPRGELPLAVRASRRAR